MYNKIVNYDCIRFADYNSGVVEMVDNSVLLYTPYNSGVVIVEAWKLPKTVFYKIYPNKWSTIRGLYNCPTIREF